MPVVQRHTKEDTHAYPQEARRALADPLRRPGQRHPAGRAARRYRTRLVRRPGRVRRRRRTRRAPDGCRQPAAAYFCEHAFSHWLVGRALGIRFTGYGLHGTSHPHLYPPGARFLFSHLPLLSARVDPASLRVASPAARAAMYAAGTVGTVLVGLAIPTYARWRGVSGSRGLLVASGVVTNAFVLLSEALRSGGDLNRAWLTLRERAK